MGVPDTDKMRRHLNELHALLRQHGADATRHVLDQLKSLPKNTLFRLSHEAIAAELPDTAAEFATLDTEEEPTTLSGRTLRSCVRDHRGDLASMSAFDFARIFISHYLARAFADSTGKLASIKLRLYGDAFFEHEARAAEGLEHMQALWLLDPRNADSPDNATAAVYRRLDPISIWACWSRQLTQAARNWLRLRPSVDDELCAAGWRPQPTHQVTASRG
jgi:hypothetical protein